MVVGGYPGAPQPPDCDEKRLNRLDPYPDRKKPRHHWNLNNQKNGVFGTLVFFGIFGTGAMFGGSRNDKLPRAHCGCSQAFITPRQFLRRFQCRTLQCLTPGPPNGAPSASGVWVFGWLC